MNSEELHDELHRQLSPYSPSHSLFQELNVMITQTFNFVDHSVAESVWHDVDTPIRRGAQGELLHSIRMALNPDLRQ